MAIVGFAVRAGFILGWANPLELRGDSVYYHVGGHLLADGKGYLHPIEYAYRFTEVPGADHPPGYVTFLGFVSSAGFRTVLGHQLWTAALGTITIVVIAFAGRRLGGSKVGLVAAGLAALNPAIWYPDTELMSETLATLAVALIIAAAYRCWSRPSMGSAGWLGAAFGLGALSRSELLLVAPLVVAPLVWSQRRDLARAVAMLTLAALTTSAMIAPWAIYNQTRFDDPVILSNQLDRTMAASWCRDTFDGSNLGYKSYECLSRANQGATTEEGRRRNNERSWKRYAKKRVKRVPAVVAARVGRVWGLYQPAQQIDFESRVGAPYPVKAAVFVVAWIALPFAGVGLWRMRQKSIPLSPLVGPVIAVTVAAALTFGQLRYRLPAEPALMLAVSVALGGSGAAGSRTGATAPFVRPAKRDDER